MAHRLVTHTSSGLERNKFFSSEQHRIILKELLHYIGFIAGVVVDVVVTGLMSIYFLFNTSPIRYRSQEPQQRIYNEISFMKILSESEF